MSSWKHLVILGIFGCGVLALAVAAILLLWSGHLARSGERVGQALAVTRCGVSEAESPEGFVLTLDVRNNTDSEITVPKQARIMGTAADTGAMYVITEAELGDKYVIPGRRPARLQMYLHMKCADEPDWRKCFNSVYGNVAEFEIVDTLVNLPKPKLIN